MQNGTLSKATNSSLSTFVLLSFIVQKYRSIMFLRFWEERLTARILQTSVFLSEDTDYLYNARKHGDSFLTNALFLFIPIFLRHGLSVKPGCPQMHDPCMLPCGGRGFLPCAFLHRYDCRSLALETVNHQHYS